MDKMALYRNKLAMIHITVLTVSITGLTHLAWL